MSANFDPVATSSPASAPSSLRLDTAAKVLEITYTQGDSFRLPAEYLRVHSPSAEVRGHHPGQAVLQSGKRGVAITAVEAIGNYAVQLTFDDGHDSGIYSWHYLRELCVHYQRYWQQYLSKLRRSGASRG